MKEFSFDRFKQGFEVAFPEGSCALALNDLVKDGRAVLYRLGEDLEQVALVVAVDQDAVALDVVAVLSDVRHAVEDGLVVLIVDVERLDGGALEGVEAG